MISLRTSEPGMVLLQQYKVVTAIPAILENRTTYLVGAQTTIDITGLNGNVDQSYRIQGTSVNAVSADTHSLTFNGIVTNVYDSRYSYVGAASSVGSNNQPSIFMAPNSGSTSMTMFDIVIDAVTGKNRAVQGNCVTTGINQAAVPLYPTFGGIWKDNSTNITSVQFRFPSITGGYAVGTVFRIYKLQL
jgi:hypothetical protein